MLGYGNVRALASTGKYSLEEMKKENTKEMSRGTHTLKGIPPFRSSCEVLKLELVGRCSQWKKLKVIIWEFYHHKVHVPNHVVVIVVSCVTPARIHGY